jgi:hypothetical protein
LRALEGITVCDRILNVLLLQVVPGYEKEVALRFAKECDAYIGLGRYDVVLLKEEAGSCFLDEKKSFLRTLRRRIPSSSLDWMTICAIRYNGSKKDNKETQKKNVIGICCIKLAPYPKIGPLEVEEQVVKRIHEEAENVVVYAGLGYNEIICTIESDSLEGLAKEVQKIRCSLIDKKSQTKNSILDITTIPCIKISCLNTKGSVRGNSAATTILALRASPPSRVFDVVGDLLSGKVRNVFGFHDGIISSSLPTRLLLSNLLEIRKKTRQLGLYSTYTLVELDEALSTPSNDSKVNKQSSLMWQLDYSRDETLEKMVAEDEEVPEDMVYYFNVFRSLRNDPFTSDLFRNLNPFIKTQIEQLKQAKLSENTGDYRQKLKDYSLVLDSLKLALHQRLMGLEVGNLLGIKSANFDSMGGVDRVIFALESIPLRLLQQFGSEWDGFCVFEHRESIHTCVPSGILMAPRKILFKPDELCSAFHEAGHVAFIKLLEADGKISNKLMSFCEDRSKVKDPLGKTINEDEKKTNRVLFEEFFRLSSDVFSDMFAYTFGFRRDWEQYSKGLWKRLVEFDLVNYKYIARSYLVYAMSEPELGLSTNTLFDKFLSEFERTMDMYRVKITNQTKMDAKRMVDVLKDTALSFASAINARFSKVKSESDSLDDIRNSLTIGIPVAGVDPSRIICAIAGTNLKPTTTFAAILSLYAEGPKKLATSVQKAQSI